jgi:hypothetical protein
MYGSVKHQSWVKQGKPPGEKRVRGLKRSKVRPCSIWERFPRLRGGIDRSEVRTTEGGAAEGRINIDGEVERTRIRKSWRLSTIHCPSTENDS